MTPPMVRRYFIDRLLVAKPSLYPPGSSQEMMTVRCQQEAAGVLYWTDTSSGDTVGDC